MLPTRCARHLALAYPGQKTLLLCYNKVLAEWLRARIADCPSVTVRHFDGWAKDQRLSRRPSDKDDAAFGARVLDALRKRGAAAREWDTVLIDEAQDFEPTWFQCALAAMHDPGNGDLVIVADGSRRLYKRNGLSWKAIGIKAAGRTISARYDLDKNYRNTPVIAALAHGFSDEEINDDGINARRVGPNTCRRTNYSKPVLVEAGDHASQVDAAIEIVARWIRGERAGHSATPIRPEDIGIFSPKLERNSRLLDQLIAGLAGSRIRAIRFPISGSTKRRSRSRP
jgi:superfamily I DNA/RNA helicase